MMPHIWEYLTEKVEKEEELEEKLNGWRKEGWEVYSCVKTKHNEVYSYYVNMKRAIDINPKKN